MAVRKGTKARPSQVHEPKTRYRRSDMIDGVSMGDWFEQQLIELTEQEKEDEDVQDE